MTSEPSVDSSAPSSRRARLGRTLFFWGIGVMFLGILVAFVGLAVPSYEVQTLAIFFQLLTVIAALVLAILAIVFASIGLARATTQPERTSALSGLIGGIGLFVIGPLTFVLPALLR
jgi:hypothetical protein